MQNSENGPEPISKESLSLAKQRTDLASERTQMAAERTFSAWIRTGLAGVGGGLAIAHFLIFRNPLHKMASVILAELLILWGVGIFIFSYVSYLQFCRRLEQTSGYKTPKAISGIIIFILLLFSIFFLILNVVKFI